MRDVNLENKDFLLKINKMRVTEDIKGSVRRIPSEKFRTENNKKKRKRSYTI